MNHRLVSEDTEETSDKGQDVDEAEDRDPEQKLLLLRLELEGLHREFSEQIRARRALTRRFSRAVDRLGFGHRHRRCRVDRGCKKTGFRDLKM